ncbi:MAG TPA: hypothetical protein VJC13_02700 [Candidatus Paceibacterota bacterium]
MKKQDLKSRIAALMLGHTVDQLTTKGYTYVVLPPIMAYFGMAKGMAINFFLSFLICLAFMKFYDWAKVDWLGLETAKEVREEGEKGNKLSRLLSWALRKGDWVVLLILSIYKDAFFCTVWMRKGAHQYNGMSSRDWGVFMTTLALSTVWESLWVTVLLVAGKAIWSVL